MFVYEFIYLFMESSRRGEIFSGMLCLFSLKVLKYWYNILVKLWFSLSQQLCYQGWLNVKLFVHLKRKKKERKKLKKNCSETSEIVLCSSRGFILWVHSMHEVEWLSSK